MAAISDILKAVETTIQLGGFCYDVAKRIHDIKSDRELSKTIHTECIALIAEIDEQYISLIEENRSTADALKSQLSAIRSRIEKRPAERNWLRKVWTSMRLYGASDREDMLTALIWYQTRIEMSSIVILQKIDQQVGPDGISRDLEQAKAIIVNKLATLQAKVQEQKKRRDDEILKVFSALRMLVRQVRESRKDVLEVKEDVQEIKQLINFLLPSLVVAPILGRCNITSSIMDGAQSFEGPAYTMEEYMRRLETPGGCAADENELFSSFDETCRIFRESAYRLLIHGTRIA
jgi:hypothetical protein